MTPPDGSGTPAGAAPAVTTPPPMPPHPAPPAGPDPPGPATPPGPAALAATVLAAATGNQLQNTLRAIIDAAVRHVDAAYGALGVVTAEGRRLHRFIVAGDRGTAGSRLAEGPAVRRLLMAEQAGLHLGAPGEDLPPDSAAATTADTTAEDVDGRAVLGVRVRAANTVFGRLYLTDKRGGGSFTAADVEVAQALAAVAGLAIENARLAEEADIRRRWGQAATDTATALLSGDDPDDVLRTVSARVRELTGADIAGVLAPSGADDGTLTIVTAVGHAAADVEGVRVPLAGSYVGETYASGKPRLITDISTMPVVGRRAAVVVELTAGFGPAMVVPMGNAPGHGMLVALRTTDMEPFGPLDLELLATFATHASVVLQLARAQQRERRLQVQADRDRIARDLHDHVVQRIFATALSLDRLGRSLQPRHADAAARLARSVDELDATMAEIRAAIFELHQDEGTEPLTVRQRLCAVVLRVTEGHDLRCDVRGDGPVDDLPRHLLPDLVAVLRELTTNVVKHAAATRVSVTVEAHGELAVTVADDGIGIPPAAARSGLANLADRAERRGGRLWVSAGPTGTEVTWTVPLPASR